MRLDDMAPPTPISDPANVTALDTEIVRDGLLRFPDRHPSPNLPYDSVRQGRHVVTLALLLAVPALVGVILLWRTPVEVAQSVVVGDAIFVTSLVACGPGANKVLEDELVNVAEAATSPADLNREPVVAYCLGVNSPLLQSPPFSPNAPPIVDPTPNGAVHPDPVLHARAEDFVSHMSQLYHEGTKT